MKMYLQRIPFSLFLIFLFLQITAYTQLNGNLNGIDTLKLEDSPFLVTGNIYFSSGTHVIEAGVELQFEPNTGLEIGQANMNFEGTAANPITFTSSGVAGLWNGVYFNSVSDNGVISQMDYVIIQNAGNGSWNANLYCVSTNQPVINNSTFSMADGHGIRLNDANLSILSSEFSLNTESGIYIQNSNPSLISAEFTGNDFAGVQFADITSSPSLTSCSASTNNYGIHYPTPNYSFPELPGISTSGNIYSSVAMPGGDITEDQSWPFKEGGYAILGDVVIRKQNDKARLTVAPGNTLYFDESVQMQVGQYIFYNQNHGGELYAIGKPDSTITFTSMNGEIGGWDGIYYHYNSDAFGSQSFLTYCTIEKGKDYNVKSDGSAEPRIDNCTINNSSGYDIYAVAPNDVQYVTNTTSTVFIGSGVQNINKTWYNFSGGDYVVVGDIIVAKQNDTCRLTIEPGITVKVDTTFGLQIAQYVYYNQNHGGELYAIGNADSLITFTSRNGEVGGWDGIYFHYNSDAFGNSSFLTYCNIEKGNNYNVKSDGSAEPRIDNCTINNSAGYDIYAVAPNDVQHVTNTNSTVYVGEGVQTINKTWYNFSGGDYVVVGDIIVAKHNDTVRLTIQPGNTIQVDTTFGIQIGQYVYYNQNHGGELYAIGNTDSLIKFTSRNSEVGGWDGIYFHYNSDAFDNESFLTYCNIEKGKDFNVKSDGSAEPRIDNCTINNSAGYDIYAVAPNDVQHITNTTSTVFVGAGVQTINKTWYNFSGGDYVVVGDIIVAKHNDTVRLTIQPGNTIQVDTTFGIQIAQYVYYNQNHGGELYAIGNVDSLITFTSRNSEVGGWDGIYFHYNSDAFDNSSFLTYCNIEKGNNYNVKSDGSAEPRIDNCTINNSAGYDIYAVAPNDVQHVTNTTSTIYIGEGIQNIDKTWYNFGGSYSVIGNVIIGGTQNNYNTLTVQPGNMIKFDSAVILQIGNYIHYNQHYGGKIFAEGTPDNLITFYSENCLDEIWGGIRFHENADNYGGTSSFKHCIINGAQTNNLYCNATDSINFEQVTFIHSGQTGALLHNSSPYLKLCQFVNNDSIGVLLTGNSNPVIGDTVGSACDIYGNGYFGIYNSTANTILARNNYWNTIDSEEINNSIYDLNDNASYGEVLYVSPSETSDMDIHPPEMFDLLSLADFEATTDQTPSFSWNEPNDPDADSFTYYFYYTDDSTWTSNVIVSPEIMDPSYTIPETLTGGKWYWWKVKASDGHLTVCSDIWRFAVSLPPSVPVLASPANGAHLRETDYLEWLVSTDPDFGDTVSYYHLQIDDNPDFSSPEVDTNDIVVVYGAPDISMLISILPAYTLLENKNYFWRVSAIDGFGIESDFSDGSNYFLYLLDVNIKLFLEGPYKGVSMDNSLNLLNLLPLTQPYNISPWNYSGSESVVSISNPNIIDWLLIELRSTEGDVITATSDKAIYQEALFVLNDGTVTNTSGDSNLEIPVSFDDNVFMVIYHRSHLGIISSNPLSPIDGKYENDFTSGSENVYGGSSGYSEIITSIWGMSSGDANTSGIVNEDDKNLEWSNQAGETGYLFPDLNLDGQVDNIDKNEKLLNNIGKESQIPE